MRYIGMISRSSQLGQRWLLGLSISLVFIATQISCREDTSQTLARKTRDTSKLKSSGVDVDNGALVLTSKRQNPFLWLIDEEKPSDANSPQNIRRQRQIKFKSSYTELPEALKRAKERNQQGKSLNDDLQIVTEDANKTIDSFALKELPPSSEVYFSQEIDDPKYDAVNKHFGRVATSFERSPRKNLFRSIQTLHNGNNLQKKRKKILKKKMVGRKLIKPNPEKLDTNSIVFQVSSTEKVLSSTSRNNRRGFQFPRKLSKNNNSQTGQGGGPNPNESYRNPHYVETPSNEVSSYSFVPDSSFVGASTRTSKKSKSSGTPVPQVVHQLTTKRDESKLKESQHFHRFNEQPSASTRTTIQRKNQLKLKTQLSSSTSSKWDHFLQNQNAKSLANKTPLTKISPFNSGERRGKSLSSASKSRTFAGKSVSQRAGDPNLLNVPRTSFRCGDYKGGEYFADVETKCQVFHVCFGGRRASFLCPMGTAFSQDLLVCDWWHKVKCEKS